MAATSWRACRLGPTPALAFALRGVPCLPSSARRDACSSGTSRAVCLPGRPPPWPLPGRTASLCGCRARSPSAALACLAGLS
eukprot:7318864-Alexandrium_andersonii.AAC.1